MPYITLTDSTIRLLKASKKGTYFTDRLTRNGQLYVSDELHRKLRCRTQYGKSIDSTIRALIDGTLEEPKELKPAKDNNWVYCDRDPRDQGCLYWTDGKYITAAKAWDLTMMHGYGLLVKNGEKP